MKWIKLKVVSANNGGPPVCSKIHTEPIKLSKRNENVANFLFEKTENKLLLVNLQVILSQTNWKIWILSQKEQQIFTGRPIMILLSIITARFAADLQNLDGICASYPSIKSRLVVNPGHVKILSVTMSVKSVLATCD